MSGTKQKRQRKKGPKNKLYETVWFHVTYGVLLFGVLMYVFNFADISLVQYQRIDESAEAASLAPAPPPTLDKDAYNTKMLALAHYEPPAPVSTSTATSTASSTPPAPKPYATATTSVGVPGLKWPTPAVYPNVSALLPFKRIIAYYGNFYSRQMGVLGEYPEKEVLTKLASTTAMWAQADPSTPTIPAIQYIAVVAQGQQGQDGMWRSRMPDSEIQHAFDMADSMEGLLFLDVQVGQSTLQKELPLLANWFELPNVELAIDPEFSMKTGKAPGTVIGSYDATDINYAITYLAGIVREHNLPPKVLVVHRFTYDMVTNTEAITPLPEVQVVMDMDGWGEPARKFNTYKHVIAPYPVQFTGMKLFYHADLRPPSTRLLTPAEVLALTPSPIYIQYQ